ncbi:MAG: AAA family ATPase [Candidatus Nanopelagicales bacterium]|nr:AAA family ATPase [Candidatus Nanopelagicales bacterium]
MTSAVPEIRVEAGHYIVTYGDLQANFSRLREEAGRQFGGLNGEVSISTTLPGVPPHLHEARINLSSTSGRDTLLKAIKSRVKGGALVETLEDFVEYACVMTLRAFRQGTPLLNLANVTYQPVPFAVEKVFPLDKRCQLYAPAENFKTTLGMAFLQDIATGLPMLGFAVTEGPVAYIDWETDENDASNIWHRLARGRDYPVPDLLYLRAHRPIWEEAESLAPQLAREGVKAVLLDSAFWACGANPNDQEKVGTMFQGIDALGRLTSILLNHTGAAESGKKRRRHYGLEHFRNAVRASWELRKADTPGAEWISLGLYRDKLNMLAPEPPFGFRIRFTPYDGPIYVERDDKTVSATPELDESRPISERVKTHLLAHGMTSPLDLAKALGELPNAIHQAVRRLGNQIVREGNGRTVRYGMAARREE